MKTPYYSPAEIEAYTQRAHDLRSEAVHELLRALVSRLKAPAPEPRVRAHAMDGACAA